MLHAIMLHAIYSVFVVLAYGHIRTKSGADHEALINIFVSQMQERKVLL